MSDLHAAYNALRLARMSDLHAAYNALREAHGLPAVLGDPSPHEAHRLISILYAAWKEREHWPELLAVERALRDLAEGGA